MTDDSSFGNTSTADNEPKQLYRQGATCNTYLVRYYGKLVLMKQIRPEYADSVNYRMLFRKEFEAGFSLNHPAFPRYLNQGEHDGRAYIIEEYIDGITLTDFLKSHPNYFHDRANADKFARQLLSALSYLHQHQMLFLDLKPENILITRIDHDVRLVDLGFAFVAGYPETAGLTPSFAAPEQSGKRKVDERTDIWLYGRILQYAGVDPIYNKVIDRCMQADPDDRYSGMAQLQKQLPALRRPIRRKIIISTVILLLAMIGLMMLLSPSTSQRKQEPTTQKRSDSVQVIPSKQLQPSSTTNAESPRSSTAAASAALRPTTSATAAPAATQSIAEATASTNGGQSANTEQQRMLADLHRMMDRAFNRHLSVLRDSTFDALVWSAHYVPYDEAIKQGKADIIRKYPDISEDYIDEQFGRYKSKTVAPVLAHLRMR